MATPNAVQTARTTKSGTSLEDFSDVSLYKVVPQTLQVTSLQEALAMVGNDEGKLLALFTDGLNQATVQEARKSPEGWKIVDENGKDTETTFSGSLVSPEILNPVVLMMAKLNHGFDEIPKSEKSADLKRAAKEAALRDIRESPLVLAGLKKKMEAAG
jgi:hypothetical protein